MTVSSGQEAVAVSPDAGHAALVLGALLGGMSDWVLVADSAGTVVSVSRALAEGLGVGERHVVGKPLWNVFLPGETQDRVREAFGAGDAVESLAALGPLPVASGGPAGAPARHVRWTWRRVSGSASRAGAPSVIGIGVPQRDLDPVEEMAPLLKAAEQKFQSTIDAMPAGIICYTRDLEIVAANRMMARAFGLKVGSMVGRRLGELAVHPDFHTFAAGVFGEGEVRTMQELSVGPPEGARHYVLLGRLYDNGRAAITLVFDVTLRHQAEREVRNALEKERSLSELRARFLAMVSHEFRTPLQTILLSAKLVERHETAAAPPDPRKARSLGRIRAAAEGMSRFLADVLEIGRADAGKIEVRPAPLELVGFVEDIVEILVQGEAGHREVRCDLPARPVEVETDERLLRSVLTNLLTNACKYSESGAPIDVTVRRDGTEVVFAVRDRGPGLSPDDLAKVFEPFHRGANTGGKPGAGLGLAVVERFAGLLGGRAWAESEVGVGSVFSVAVPITGEA